MKTISIFIINSYIRLLSFLPEFLSSEKITGDSLFFTKKITYCKFFSISLLFVYSGDQGGVYVPAEVSALGLKASI